MGVLLFLCIIHDLKTGCETMKYVADITMYHLSSDVGDKSLQVAIGEATDYTSPMHIVVSKTKKMLIPFARSCPNVNGIVVGDSGVDCVDHCMLLGLKISNNLSLGAPLPEENQEG